MKQCESCAAQFEDKWTRCPECGVENAKQLTKGEQIASSYMDFLHEQGKTRERFNAGVQAFLDGRFVEAEQAYKQTLKVFPKTATVHGNMGHLLIRQGKIEAAIPCLERALELNPMPAGIALRQMFTVEDTVKLEDALEHFRAVEGIPEMLEHARGILARMQSVFTNEAIEQLKTRRRGRSTPATLLEQDKTAPLRTAMGTCTCTYARYKAKTAADALDFLAGVNVSTPFHYIEVETPDGLIGKDVNDLYRL